MENVRAVERALELLDCLSEAQKDLGLSELSRQLVLPKATVLRLARTLESKGYVIQDGERQAYRLGPKVVTLGRAFLADLDFRQVALPFMQDLRDKIQEAASLYVVCGSERMCVQRVETPHTLRQVINIGDRLPLNRGSAGKLLVAFHGLGSSVSGIDQEEIKQILKQGYAVSREEREQGLASISVPLYDASGKVLSSLTVAGPVFRFTPENIEYYLAEVKNTARQISYQLGYLG